MDPDPRCKLVIYNDGDDPLHTALEKFQSIFKLSPKSAQWLVTEIRLLGGVAIEMADQASAEKVRAEFIAAGSKLPLRISIEPADGAAGEFPFKPVGEFTRDGLALHTELLSLSLGVPERQPAPPRPMLTVEAPMIDPGALALPWRGRFQLHLSTAFVLMVLSAILLPTMMTQDMSASALAFFILALLSTAFFCEWSISLQKDRKAIEKNEHTRDT